MYFVSKSFVFKQSDDAIRNRERWKRDTIMETPSPLSPNLVDVGLPTLKRR